MIAGVLALVVANLASLLGAHALMLRVRAEPSPMDFALLQFLRLLIISTVVLLAGLTHSLTAPLLGGLAVIALVALVLCGAHRRIARPSLPMWGGLLIGSFALVALRLLLQVWLFSPHLGDALSYHLPKIAEWIRASGFTREMGVHTHVTFPAGFELIETWWVVFLHHDALIELAGVEFLLLAAGGTYALARLVGLDERFSAFGALLYVLVPGLHLGATACINDTAVAALLVATAALIAGGASLPLIVSAMGLGLGIKPTYGFALPGLGLLCWFYRGGGHHFRAPAVIAAAAGLGTGAYWYVRNLVWFGNPFYPLGSPGFVDPTPVQFGPSLRSLFANFVALVDFRIYDTRTILGANVDEMAGWGGAAVACGSIALISGVAESLPLRRLAAAFGLSLAGSLMFSLNDSWCLKYVFFFPALLCIAAAKSAQEDPKVRLLAAVAAAFAFAGTFLPYDLPPSDLRILARQSGRDRTAAKLALWQAQREVPDSVVGYFGGPLGPTYLLYRPDFSRRVEYFRSPSADQLLAGIDRAGVATIYAMPESEGERHILEECIARGRLQVLQGRFYRVVR
jgi:hypothetical protein